MKRVLADIQSGRLRQELRARQPRRPARAQGRAQGRRGAPDRADRRQLRAMMPWISANKLVDQEKN
jgi:ketol-acid reductoisomerase